LEGGGLADFTRCTEGRFWRRKAGHAPGSSASISTQSRSSWTGSDGQLQYLVGERRGDLSRTLAVLRASRILLAQAMDSIAV